MTTFDKLKESLKTKMASDNNETPNEDNANSLFANLKKPKKILYENWGFDKARNLNGSNTGLLSCLALIREDHKQMVQRDENTQKRLKEPMIAELITVFPLYACVPYNCIRVVPLPDIVNPPAPEIEFI